MAKNMREEKKDRAQKEKSVKVIATRWRIEGCY